MIGVGNVTVLDETVPHSGSCLLKQDAELKWCLRGLGHPVLYSYFNIPPALCWRAGKFKLAPIKSLKKTSLLFEILFLEMQILYNIDNST